MKTDKTTPVKVVRKDGVVTTVHKNLNPATNSRAQRVPVQKGGRVNPATGFSEQEYEKMAELIEAKLSTEYRSVNLRSHGFVDAMLDPNNFEFWMSNGVNEYKLYGNGTDFNPFRIMSRSALKSTLRDVDKLNEEIADLFGTRLPPMNLKPEIDGKIDGTKISFNSSKDGHEVSVDLIGTGTEPFYGIDPIIEDNQDGTYSLTWASVDHEAANEEYKFMDGDSFQEFDYLDDRDAYIQKLKDEGVDESRIFVIDKLEHGVVHYSVENTKNYPDRKFDVAPRGVFVLGEAGFPDYDKDESYEDAVRSINDILEEYSAHSNGECFAILNLMVNENGAALRASEALGYIGVKYTQNQMRDYIAF